MDKTSLGDRMKGYERVAQSNLIKRMPVIIRLDGRAFHTYTKRCEKPFDFDLSTIRSEVMDTLCQEIQGVLFGYSQSDEISLVLKDWDTFNTQPWFGNKLQKLVSVSASICTAYWNVLAQCADGERIYGSDKFLQYATFDSRAFNIPKEEVVNYLIWRQQDWERNSVQMLARSKYSHKACHKKSCKELITMLEEEHGIVYGDLPIEQKRGEFWIRGRGLTDCPIFKHTRSILQEHLENSYD